MKQIAWKIYRPDSMGRLSWMDTVYFNEGMEMEEIRNSLIDHDGYPGNIVVRHEILKSI